MSGRRLTFQGAHGDRLVARLEMPPDDSPRAFALFAHCFTCSKDLGAAVHLSRALAGRRIAVLRFDFTGLGESEGDFADTNFSSNVGDLVAAAEYMDRELEAPRVLVGHSLGGAAVIRAAPRVPSSVAVATLGAPADPSHVRRLLAAEEPAIRARGEAEVELAGRTFRIRRQFLEDLESTRMAETLSSLDRALLVFHSPVDNVVGVENAARIFEQARHPKSFVSLDRADHLLTRRHDARYAGDVLAAWARKYLPGAEKRSAKDEGRGEDAGRAEDGDRVGDGARVGDTLPVSEEGRVAARIDDSRFRTEILAGGHALLADEPETAGGTDQGPSPYDLLLAALGSCTAMTLRMYADRKDWPLDEVTVSLEHSRVHADDDRECEEGDPRVDRIGRLLRLRGDLDGEQRRRLAEIAGKCPVHRTLEAGVRVETALEDS